jgi:hypothetical protein
MPLWIKDGIRTPGGGLVTPLTSYIVRRWSFPGSVLPPRGPTIDDIYYNNNNKTVVAIAGPTNSIPQEARHLRLAVKVVVVAKLTGSTPRGAVIDVFYNIGGGHCRIH